MDKKTGSYVKYIVIFKSDPVFLSNAINDTHGRIKEFYIDLLKDLPLYTLFGSYTAVKLMIDLNIYTADYISQLIVKGMPLHKDVIYYLLEHNYIKDFMGIYNLSIEYKRDGITRQLNSYILNQV